MNRNRSTAALLAACCAFLQAFSAPVGGTRQDRFRGGTDLVLLDVVVLDTQRRPVTGLTAADFEIVQDGQLLPVRAFSAISLQPRPVIAAGTHPFPSSDVVSNQRDSEGRLVVILMDASIPVGAFQVDARKVARAAVDALAPGDLAAVVRSSAFAMDGSPQGFTDDKERLFAAIDSPSMGATKSPPNGPGGGGDPIPDIRDSISCACGLCQWDALQRIAEALQAERRRQKVLLFIGRDLVVQDSPSDGECAFRVRYAREKGLRALDRANLTVHSIDPSGLETLAASASGRTRAGAAGNLQRQANLGVLPEYTGGRTVLNTNDPERLVPRIFDESSSYYLLGIDRFASQGENQRKRIQVRLKRRAGLTVLARTGYFPSEPAANAATVEPDSLAAQIQPLLPPSELPMQLVLSPIFLPDRRPAVNIMLGVDLTSSSLRPSEPAEVAVAVYDRSARLIMSTRSAVDVRSSPTASGMEWTSHFPVKPGGYEVRIGFLDQAAQREGGVYGYVDVPDPEGSMVVIAGARLAIDSQPTLRRSFKRLERVDAFIDLARRGATEPLSVILAVVDERGRDQDTSTVAVDPLDFNKAGILSLNVDVPTSRLSPGRYLLKIWLRGVDSAVPIKIPFSIN